MKLPETPEWRDVTETLITEAYLQAYEQGDAEIVLKIEGEFRANDARDEDERAQWSMQAGAELMRIIRKGERR